VERKDLQLNETRFEKVEGIRMDVHSILKHYITTEIMHELDSSKLPDDEPLIEGGIIDSMNLIKLVVYIKECFGIEIGENELDIENFQTLNALTAFIMKKRSD
jgi:acyl carrier protein